MIWGNWGGGLWSDFGLDFNARGGGRAQDLARIFMNIREDTYRFFFGGGVLLSCLSLTHIYTIFTTIQIGPGFGGGIVSQIHGSLLTLESSPGRCICKNRVARTYFVSLFFCCLLSSEESIHHRKRE